MTAIKKMSFSKKIILFNILFITLPTLIFAGFLYVFESRRLYQQLDQERKLTLNQLVNNLETKLTSVEDLSQSLAYKSAISSVVTRSDLNLYSTWTAHSSEEILIDLKYSLKYQNLGLDDASIYTNNPDIPDLNKFHDISNLYDMAFYQDFRNNKKSFDLYYLSATDANKYYSAKGNINLPDTPVLLFVQKIQPDFSSGYSGILVLESEPEKFFSSLSIYENTSSGYFVYFHNLSNYFGCTPSPEIKIQLKSNPYSASDTKTNILSSPSQSLTQYQLTVIAQTSENENTYFFSAFKLSLFLIVMTIIQCIVLQLLVNNIFRRINLNITEMDEIIANEFTGKVTVDSEDEIGFIAQRYNTLLEKIDTLISKETEAKEAQIKALQFQINPHFIYNTLSIFAGNAQHNGNFRLAEAISYFGHLLRYNVKDTGLYSTIGLELENARSLIKVYSLKFTGKLEMNISAPDYLLKRKLIKFLLQPIIENSIFHGTSGISSSLTISLKIWEEDQILKIQITDNGIGIEKAQLEQIQLHILYGTALSPSIKSGSSFIGLHNVYKRIQLVYGSDAALDIQSTPGQGAQVTVCLPQTSEGGVI